MIGPGEVKGWTGCNEVWLSLSADWSEIGRLRFAAVRRLYLRGGLGGIR